MRSEWNELPMEYGDEQDPSGRISEALAALSEQPAPDHAGLVVFDLSEFPDTPDSVKVSLQLIERNGITEIDRITMGDVRRVNEAIAALTASAKPEVSRAPEAFQQRVQPWMMACFGPEISGDRVERGDRLLEEVFELLQSGGYDPSRVLALRDYVWGREKGEPSQEAGGVMVTLAAYCLAHELDMHEAGETELARIWTKVDKIRAKQAAKPTGSALPIAIPPAPQQEPVGYVSPTKRSFTTPHDVSVGYLVKQGWTPVYATPLVPQGEAE